MNKKSILAEIFGSSWAYEVPDDKEQQLYDFYMLSALLPQGIELYLKSLDFDEIITMEDKVYYTIYEAANKLLPVLKENLIKAVLFSLMAELRHVLDAYKDENSYDYDYNKEGIRNLVKNVSQDLGAEYAEMFVQYISQYTLFNSPASALMERPPIDKDLKSTHKSRKASYRAMLKIGGTAERWATLAKYLFKNGKWSSSFGGKAWENIADAWLNLNKAKAAGQIMGWIDRVYDLQHNTDTVFNKLDSYLKAGSYDWLKKALDKKRYIKVPYEIVDDVSPPMKKLMPYAMWHLYHISGEEFAKEKHKYNAEREAEIQKYHGEEEPHKVYSEPEVDKDMEIKKYLQNTYTHLTGYPINIMAARLALHIPFYPPEEVLKFKKINDILNLGLSEIEIMKSVPQLAIEKDNQEYYHEKGGNYFYFSNFNYMSVNQAQNEFDKYFKNSPNVFLVHNDFKSVLNSIRNNQFDAAVQVIKAVTNYNLDAVKTLAYRIMLSAIIKGDLGQEYHEKGYQQKLIDMKEKSLRYWHKNGTLPLELKLTRGVTAIFYGKIATTENIEDVAKSLSLNLNSQQIKAVRNVYLDEKKKESYFEKVNYPYFKGLNRQSAYEVIEKYFKNAPLVKLDYMEEKNLEKMVLNSTQKISAIKLFRESTAWGLKASKSYIEYLQFEMIYLGAKVS